MEGKYPPPESFGRDLGLGIWRVWLIFFRNKYKTFNNHEKENNTRQHLLETQ